ncbi:hypothetical protein P2Q00_00035 [Streptomyces coacervatus]|uniref:hypothetical protein n=1 Tax=Streptomyces coacervatus TaxID=647381 RepID=UPI0023DAE034|nr:hypothetical protein [Streptomyces coacervatus]MDF2263836.1 hypothetical protein [Streptomyces coacervatus]
MAGRVGRQGRGYGWAAVLRPGTMAATAPAPQDVDDCDEYHHGSHGDQPEVAQCPADGTERPPATSSGPARGTAP